MLAALLKPVGAVTEGTDLPSQLLYSSDSVCYRYKAKVNSLKTTEAAHQFNVLIEIDRRGNLRRLAAQSPTYPGPTGENFTYKMEFFSHSEPTNILLKLPNELLLNIAAYTGTDGQGTELNLRAVNRQLKGIADKSLSSVQDFVITHGKVLEASGYEGWEMHALAIQPVDEQNFLLSNNRENLYGAGYHGYEMNELANQPVDQQKFVLDNLNTLKAAGYEGYEMNVLARRPTDEQLFVLNNYLSLKEEGYNGWAMNNLAAQPDVERNAVLQNVKQM
ncbi:hypothetical protein EAH72_34270 [Pseudomonas caspiana]|nr:hypothetical protein EAH72_34270 [Pseudomonas caspiana]